MWWSPRPSSSSQRKCSARWLAFGTSTFRPLLAAVDTVAHLRSGRLVPALPECRCEAPGQPEAASRRGWWAMGRVLPACPNEVWSRQRITSGQGRTPANRGPTRGVPNLAPTVRRSPQCARNRDPGTPQASCLLAVAWAGGAIHGHPAFGHSSTACVHLFAPLVWRRSACSVTPSGRRMNWTFLTVCPPPGRFRSLPVRSRVHRGPAGRRRSVYRP